ncbi:MAG: ABC transporter permease [Candidatus Nanohalarchaeota archaeon]|nr:MAG: ABC transporter permease [Candidatus Nanohaloarchaeota archaeon]
MKTSKCLKHALNMVIHSKLRSWLTILGIVIGVGSVIAIMSLGEGLQQNMEAQMSGLGGDILTIYPGFSKSRIFRHEKVKSSSSGSQAAAQEIVLDWADVQALKGIPDLELIDTNIRGNAQIYYLGKSGSVTLTGVDQKVWSKITTTELRDGRMLGPADMNVIVIGARLADNYFDKPLGINKMVNIEDKAFRIVGILDDSSNSIIMPLQMAYTVLDDKENGVYDSIVVKIKNEDELDYVIEKIEHKLMMIRHVTEKNRDFSVSSSKQFQEMKSEMLGSMTLFLTAIAAVSLLVGAVGIANTMFTSVLEKTKEIGIMKAIGARNKDILLIFLLNAGLIGLVGGLIGVLLGVALSGFVPMLMGGMPMSRGGVTTVVSMESVVLALSVAVIIGVISGVVPAYNGSKLKPVDALRYE